MTQRTEVDELIVRLLRCHLRQDDPTEIVERILTFQQPALLLQRGDAEGVTGLLAEIVSASPDPSASHNPDAKKRIDALKSRHHQIFAHGARTLEMLEDLGAAFSRAGLRALVLKGAALLAGPYREHLGCRPVSDIDLLVRRRELPEVRRVLTQLGLRPLATRWRGDGIEIDLHVDLSRSALIGHRRAAYRFSDHSIWQSSLPCPVGGTALRVLAPELQILHLATHGVKHAFSRWIWLVDLARLLPALDPEALLAAASQVQADRALDYCQELLSCELGFETPLAAANLPTLSPLERAWLRQIASRQGPMQLGRVVAGFSIPSLFDRLTYWREVAFPPADTLGRSYTQTSGLKARGFWMTQTLLPRVSQALRWVARTAF